MRSRLGSSLVSGQRASSARSTSAYVAGASAGVDDAGAGEGVSDIAVRVYGGTADAGPPYGRN
jgi:hypothetical protein